MNTNIEELVKKYIAPYSLSDTGGTANMLRNALTEQAGTLAAEQEATVNDLTSRLIAVNREVVELIEKPTTSIPAAELDALRKDAERYRWLSKITPYHFKQIQSNAITDSGDVVYFHLDKLSAAIDAAIAGETE